MIELKIHNIISGASLQDRVWGSDASPRRHRAVTPHHAPSLSPPCNGLERVAERLAECSAVARPRAPAPAAAAAGEGAAALRPADVVGCAWPAGGAAAAGAALVALYTGSGGEPQRFSVELGHWPAGAPPGSPVGLRIGARSACRGQAHVCEAQIVLEGPDGGELGAQPLLLFFHPALS